jgi:peptidoglycan/xylan/chitin deacetylase (PgdA/CDA1 family)
MRHEETLCAFSYFPGIQVESPSVITKFLRRFYHAMQRRHPSLLWYGDPARREIALTFDDGPHPRDTPRILDVLAKHDIPATFFLVGQFVERNLSVAQQIHRSGHQIGIHGYRHFPFPLENPSTLKAQLDRARNVIADACGISVEEIRDVRPPYGVFTGKILPRITDSGYRFVMWSSVPPHWLQPVNWTIKQVLDEVVPGSIIDLHDGKGHGSNLPQILHVLLPALKSQGFGFITINEMQRHIFHNLEKTDFTIRQEMTNDNLP